MIGSRQTSSETQDAGSPSSWPHPCTRSVLFGHSDAEAFLLSAYCSNRMPHAWLIEGPRGIGKATFAYRMACFILSHPHVIPKTCVHLKPALLSHDPAVAQKIAAKSHPNLHVLCPPEDLTKGNGLSGINIDSVHECSHFFNLTVNGGGWQILIVDSVDDMNIHSANALLKILEEPPGQTLFLLIAHRSGNVLPTIRSRCCRLPLRPLGEEDLRQAIKSTDYAQKLSDFSHADQQSLFMLSQGSVRRALTLMTQGQLAVWKQVCALLERPSAQFDAIALHDLAEKIGISNDREQGFNLTVEYLGIWLHRHLRTQLEQDIGGTSYQSRLLPIVSLWEKLHDLEDKVYTFNLDRKCAFLNLFHDFSSHLDHRQVWEYEVS